MSDMGSGYYGSGPTTKWGTWVFAALSFAAGVFVLIRLGGDAWTLSLFFFIPAVLFALLAVYRDKIRAWSLRKQGRADEI